MARTTKSAGDTFHNDRHPNLKAEFILANPSFGLSEWGGDRLRDAKRWKFGAPPAGNAGRIKPDSPGGKAA